MIGPTGTVTRVFVPADVFILIASCSHFPTLSKADKKPQKAPQQTAEATKAKVQDSYGKLPLSFIQNDGVYVSLVGAYRDTPSTPCLEHSVLPHFEIPPVEKGGKGGFPPCAGEPTAQGNSSSILSDGGHEDQREEILVPVGLVEVFEGP